MLKKTIIFLLLVQPILAQKAPKDPKGGQIILSQQNQAASKFVVYEPVQPAKGLYKNIAEATNNTPEKVFESLLSETNFDWTKHNSIGGEIKPQKAEYYTKMKTMDKNLNYYALRCKWEFLTGGIPYAIVKFDFVTQEGQKTTGSYTFVKKGNRWYKHEKAYTSNINLLFIAFQDAKLKALFEAKPNQDAIHNALLSKVLSKSELDLDKLFKEYDAWEKGKDDTNITYFLDPTSWINQK